MTFSVDGYLKSLFSDVSQFYLKKNIKKILKYGLTKKIFTLRIRFLLQIGFYKRTGMGSRMPKTRLWTKLFKIRRNCWTVSSCLDDHADWFSPNNFKSSTQLKQTKRHKKDFTSDSHWFGIKWVCNSCSVDRQRIFGKGDSFYEENIWSCCKKRSLDWTENKLQTPFQVEGQGWIWNSFADYNGNN